MRYVNAPNIAFGEDRRSYKTGTNGVTSNQTVFNVSYDNGRVEAYLNGVRLYPGDDFTKSSSGVGTSITLASAIGASNVLEIVGYQGINSGNALVEDNFVVGTGSTGSGGSYTNSTTVFPVASSAGDTVSVWRNGIKLVPTTDYTVQASASTVTLLSAASSADEITVQVVGALQHNNLVQKENAEFNSGNNTFTMPTTRGADGYVLARDDSLGTGGTTWKETIASPVITSVTTPASDNSINEDDNVTMTINGGNFSNTMTVSLVDATSGNTVTGHGNLGIASFVSSAQITVNTVAATSNISNSNVKVKLDKSGLTTTSPSISVSPDPTFSAPAQTNPPTTLATILDNTAGNIEVVGSSAIVATASDSAAITYALTGGTTNGDWQFNTTTGVVTSPSSGVDAANNSYTEAFTVTATAGGDSSRTDSRTFNIIVNKAPTGGTIASSPPTGYRVHVWPNFGTFTNDFTLYATTLCDILVIAGGGGAGNGSQNQGEGGGGGAGGLVYYHQKSLSAGSYTIIVGNKGTGSTGSTARGNSGNNSRFGSLTEAIGGGGGGSRDGGYQNGLSGGSGGGGGQRDTNTNNYGSGTANQGNNGGNGFEGSQMSGGGGGGARTAGTSSPSTGVAGAGGFGYTEGDNYSVYNFTTSSALSSGIPANFQGTGSNQQYAGGGGGGGQSTPANGNNGGGNGGTNNNSGTDASTYGSGGGGQGGDGKQGIVIVRYAI